jgi:TnpA family transposase
MFGSPMEEEAKLEFTMNMLDDENKRRSTLTQLNRGEGRHSLARTIFHGKRDELRQRYREGQEDQLGALGLVLNMIVLWNTIYMEAVLNQLRSCGPIASVPIVGVATAVKPGKRIENLLFVT